MAGNYSYDKLPTLHETQDIADAIDDAFRPNSGTTLHEELLLPSRPGYSSVEQRDPLDRNSLKSVDTFESATSSGSSIEKWKKLGNRLRRKPIPGYSRGSIRRHPAAEIEPTRIGRGVWKDQLLVDRSLRSMAALMALIAIGMIIVIGTHAEYFKNRPNKNTSSVGGETRPCKEVTRKNTALLLLINVCATMVLGMSNTYQQLITSLRVDDIKYVLQKFGDSRVGTNSPFSINHKKEKKKRAWAAWVLLIMTSMPVHFLANSLIGPSYIQQLPTIVEYDDSYQYNATRGPLLSYGPGEDSLTESRSFVCWSAFRIGKPHYPKNTDVFKKSDLIYGASGDKFGATFSRIVVHYPQVNCTGLQGTETDIGALERSLGTDRYGDWGYSTGNCTMGEEVYCTLHDVLPPSCRLNVRMNAAFILAACLVVKATYMVAVNLLARGKPKRQCLTFGDVIVASASNPEIRVQGECMVNATENYRRHNTHTCHKHCINPEESKTGDEIGHCQKCKKWNSTDKFCNEPQPTIATKIKKSLISNLGNTALTQLCLLMFCSIFLLGASIAIAVPVAMQSENNKEKCRIGSSDDICELSASARVEEISGGWGGFNRSLPLTSMPPDQLSNEFVSFCISNGAQFIYSLLYLMMIYNITLIIQESEWGKLEYGRRRLRSTMVKGESFTQSYLLQLPKKILFPVMIYSVLLHWMLGEALQAQEAIWLENADGRHIEHSKYIITYAAYPLWLATFLIMFMTGVCWWAFTYRREGFIPQMFGSIRTLCAATTQLDDFPLNGIQWGDLGMGKQFRHAGLSAEQVMKIIPHELYADGEEKSDGKEEVVEERACWS